MTPAVKVVGNMLGSAQLVSVSILSLEAVLEVWEEAVGFWKLFQSLEVYFLSGLADR